ncbi:MAG: hypothetical protein IH956_10455 [Chloroflexi bacterium]|nr:hypothetical protein [Chloroflexota bacterium]
MAQEFLWYFNGEWVPKSRVLISPEDRGFNGDTVFDSFRFEAPDSLRSVVGDNAGSIFGGTLFGG